MSIQSDISESLSILKSGGLILCPTDTIWGISCDATNPSAVQKVFELKKRSDTKALIVLIDSENKLQRYVREVPEVAWQLIDATDKPLTIIYDGALGLAKNAIGEDGTVGIRIVEDDFCKELIRRFGKPIVSTSANASGETFSGLFKDISQEIISGVDYIVNHKQDETIASVPSSIIKLDSSGLIKIIRN